MNSIALRRISIIGAILTVLVAIDGFYMVFAKYHPDDTNGLANLSDGATVLIADMNPDGEKVAAQIRGRGNTAEFFMLDVRDSAQIAMVKRVEEIRSAAQVK